MKIKHHALSVTICTVFVFLTKRESIFGSEIDKLFTFLEHLLISLLMMILVIQIRQMRITTGKTDNEVIVRRRGRRIKGTDEILKKSIVSKILAPTFDGNILKMMHQDKRTYEDKGINGRTSGMRIQRSQNIKNQGRIQLSKFMTSRSVRFRIQTFQLRTIQNDLIGEQRFSVIPSLRVSTLHIGKSLSGAPIRRTKKVHGNQVLSSLDREKVGDKSEKDDKKRALFITL